MNFAGKNSIVRTIWGTGDCVLFIFAASAGEFALSKAVDWLYFTGKLPNDPLGRLFSTVSYARQIIFLDEEQALKSIAAITQIHAAVEQNRGSRIPDWAYRDVLYMLIDYSVRAFELLERKLTAAEKNEIYDVFRRVGEHMNIGVLPENYGQWETQRQASLRKNYTNGAFTADLFRRYKKHLGRARFLLLRLVQAEMLPEALRPDLKLRSSRPAGQLFSLYKIVRRFKTGKQIRELFMPRKYRLQIRALDVRQ